MGLLEIYLMYLRKSRADGENESVEEVLSKHERMLQKLSVEKFGRPIPEEYIFREVVSGETIEDRPEMQRVLSLIESADVKGVLVVDPQRLSRGDWEDGGKILSGFKYSNTLVITPPKTYDLHNQFDYKFFKMELSRGNDYLEYVKEILRRGREGAVDAGRYIGSVAPYGYEKVTIDKAPTLKPVPHEAQAINIAIRKRLFDGMGWAFICRDLEKMGYKPRRAEHWDAYSLRDICMNPVNIGKVKWNTRKVIKAIENGKVVKKRPRNKKDPIYKDGLHEPIVDSELFQMLIDKDAPSTRENVKNPLINPLAGLLFCGTCGRSMGYRTYTRNGIVRSAPRYLCDNQVHCGTKSVSYSDLYDVLINSLESVISDFEFKMKNDKSQSIYQVQKDSIKEVENTLEELEEREEQLYDFLEDKTYTKEVFLKRMDKLQKERELLQSRLSFLKDNVVVPINYKEKIIAFRDVVDALKSEDVSAKHKNILLRKIINRIDYFRVEKTAEELNQKGYCCYYRRRGDTTATLQCTSDKLPVGFSREDTRKYFAIKLGKDFKVVRIVRDSDERVVNDPYKPMIKIQLNDF